MSCCEINFTSNSSNANVRRKLRIMSTTEAERVFDSLVSKNIRPDFKKRSYKKVSFVLTFLVVLFISSCWPGRSGKKLYSDLFGESTANCLQIIKSQDHQSIDDASAWLYFKTCSAELDRIVSQFDYSKKIITKTEAHEDETVTYGGTIPKWWTPSKLGDSCIKYEYQDQEEDRVRRLYVSMDQTMVYCRNILY